MKLTILTFLLLITFSTFAEGPTYNFNFYNNGTKTDLVTPLLNTLENGGKQTPSTNKVVEEKAEKTKDESISRSWALMVKYGIISGSHEYEETLNSKLIETSINLIIPISKSFRIIAGYATTVYDISIDDPYEDSFSTGYKGFLTGFEFDTQMTDKFFITYGIEGRFLKNSSQYYEGTVTDHWDSNSGSTYNYYDTEYNFEKLTTYALTISPNYQAGNWGLGIEGKISKVSFSDSTGVNQLSSVKYGGELFIGFYF